MSLILVMRLILAPKSQSVLPIYIVPIEHHPSTFEASCYEVCGYIFMSKLLFQILLAFFSLSNYPSKTLHYLAFAQELLLKLCWYSAASVLLKIYWTVYLVSVTRIFGKKIW